MYIHPLVAAFPPEKLAEIRDRIRLESWVQRTVRLEKKGRRWVGLCPFHNEKTPSFGVSADRQLYHCFGCGAGGDLFDYTMRLDGLDFVSAVRLLAEEAGVELPTRGSSQRFSKLDALYATNALAQEAFYAALRDPKVAGSAEAMRYLVTERGLSKHTVELFEIGWAPNDWQFLTRALAEHTEHAVTLGLLGKSAQSGRPYDRLRGRIVFPIRRPGGRIAGFGARRADWIDPEGPKYLNSPESPVYEKSSVLYGLHQAKDAIRKKRQALIVEGYLDVILLAQAGFSNVVAGCGTALTEHHAAQIARLGKEVCTLYDGDLAGRKATHRAAQLLLQAGAEVKVVTIPEGKDPDDLVREEGPDAMGERIERAEGAIDHFLRRAKLVAQGAGVAGVGKAVEAISPLLSSIKDPLQRDVAFDYCARALGVRRQSLVQHLRSDKNRNNLHRPLSHSEGPPTLSPERRIAPPHVVEVELVKKWIDNPEEVSGTFERCGAIAAFRSEPLRALLEQERADPWSSAEALRWLLERTHEAWVRSVREHWMKVEEEPHDLDVLINRLLAEDRKLRITALKRELEGAEEDRQVEIMTAIQRLQSGERSRFSLGSKSELSGS